EVAGEAAELWHASAGEDGDGSFDRGGEGQLWHARDGSRADDDDRSGIERAAARPRTLREHLIEQIGTDLPDQIG
ncbi:MAG TPA: hypothetical protein VLL94_15695, partial [Nitrospiraceae bacterium]|nr:hypothetical protein [Nitrospiraceae bacterium]